MAEQELEPMPPAPDYGIPDANRALGWYFKKQRYERWLQNVGVEEEDDPF